MKRTLIYMLFVVLSFPAFSQDIIILKSGKEIEAKVQEVGISEIKYKRFGDAESALYVVKKSEVQMIKYASGYEDVFSNPSTLPNVSYEQLMQQYKTRKRIGKGLLIPGSILFGGGAFMMGLGNAMANDRSPSQRNADAGPSIIIAGAAMFLASIPFIPTGIVQLVKAGRYKRQAMKLKDPTLSFNVTPMGGSLVLQF